MAISFIAAGAVASGANPTVSVPAGYALNDFLIIVTASSATTTTPSGWTQISAQGSGQFLTTFYKFASASESSVALSNAGSTTRAVMVAYRGVGLQDVVGTYATGTGTTATPTTQTTLLNNDFVISIYASASGTASTWTANGSTIQRVNAASTSATPGPALRGLLIADETKATAGTTTARAATLGTSNTWACFTISIREPQTLYWRNGSATWNTTTKTPWSLSSGGSGSIAVPNQLDNVIFDTNSNVGTGGFTVTLSGARCNDLTMPSGTPIDGAMILAGGTSTLFIYGSVDLSGAAGNVTMSGTPTITFGSTVTGETITTNNVFFTGSIVFNGVGGGWTLQDSWYASDANFTLTTGSFAFSSYQLQVKTFSATGTSTRTLDFGTSGSVIATAASSTNAVDFTTITGLTIVGTPLFTVDSTGAFTVGVVSNSGFTETNAPTVVLSNATGTINLSGSFKDLNFYNGATIGNNAITIYGSVYVAYVMTFTGGTNAWTFAGTTNYNITSAGNTLDFPINFNGVGGNWTLLDALTIGSTRTVTLTSGTITLSAYNLTAGQFTSTNSNTRAIAFVNGQIYLTDTTGTSIWNTTNAANLTITGTNPTVNATGAASGAGTRAFIFGSSTEANSINLNITAGTDTVSCSSTGFKSINLTGFSGTFANAARTIYGNLTISTGTTIAAGGNLTTFAATSGTKTVTTNGKTLDFPVTFNGVGGTWQLQDALTLGTIRSLNLTAGTLNLNSKNVTCGSFGSTGTSVRNITTGTGQIYCVDVSTSGTKCNMGDATNYTQTGQVIINYTGAAAAGITRGFSFGTIAGGTETNSPSLVVSNGADQVLLNYPGFIKDLTFTSGFTGTFIARTTVYGNLSIAAGVTSTSGGDGNPITMGATSGTKTITTNGCVIDQPFYIGGAGGTFQLADSLSIGDTRQFRVTNGSFDANNFNVTIGTFNSNNSNTRSITMGTGTWTIRGSGTIWTVNIGTGLTFSGASSTINLQDTSTTARIFSPLSGTVFGNLVFSGSNTVTTTFQGPTTWGTWSSTKTVPFTITMPSGSTTTLGGWTIAGSAGNLVTLNSSTPGTQATLSKSSGTVNGDYLDIKDSNATGGAVWNAGPHSVNSGNNLGWIFSAGAAAGNFFLIFM